MQVFCIFSLLVGAQSSFAYCPTEESINNGTFACPATAEEFKILRDALVSSTSDFEGGAIFNQLSKGWDACLADPKFASSWKNLPLVQACFKNVLVAAKISPASVQPSRAIDPKLTELPSQLQDPAFTTLLTHHTRVEDKNGQSIQDLQFELGLAIDGGNLGDKNFGRPTQSFPASPIKDTSADLVFDYIEKNINSKLTGERKWNVIPYASRELAFYPSILIDIPGDPEKLIHFEARTEGAAYVAVMAIRKLPDGTKDLVTTDHYTVSTQGITSKDDTAPIKDTSFCRSCHSMGIKNFSPVNLEPKFQKNYETFVSHLDEITPLKFADDPRYDLPTLAQNDGLTENRRSPRFFKKCAPDLGNDAVARVKKAMNCANCHGPTDKGAFGFSYNSAGYRKATAESGAAYLAAGANPHFGESIYTKVLTGSMPEVDNELHSTGERAALLRCLTEEFYGSTDGVPGIFQNWLAQGDCGAKPEIEAISAAKVMTDTVSTPGQGAYQVPPATNLKVPTKTHNLR